MKTKYLIIGNSAAGIGCVEGIRQIDKKGSICIISDEKYHTYSRPLISYYVKGKVSRERMNYRGDNFYTDNNVKLLSGKKVIEINSREKTVILSDNSIIAYDKLLVSTGSRAFVPPMQGLDLLVNKTTFMTMEDAERLETMIDVEKKVLIIGAGLIGLKCAEGIIEKVSEITVIDLAPRVLPSILDEDAAAMVQAHFEEKNVKFLLSRSVKSFENSDKIKETYNAILDDGTVINFDIAVLAAGVRPNTELLTGIAEIGRGIKINEHSETSHTGIYSAGDCTESIDVSSNQEKIMALLPNAYMQGECAGINMAGGNSKFNKAIPMNAIGFMSMHIITAGNYTGDVYESINENTYKKLFYKENNLKGYIFIGDIDKAGIYTNLIREKTALDSIDFALICEKPGLMAFTKEVREEKLGGLHGRNSH